MHFLFHCYQNPQVLLLCKAAFCVLVFRILYISHRMGLPRLPGVYFLFLFLLHIPFSVSLPQSILEYLPKKIHAVTFSSGDGSIAPEDYLFCDSWRASVEVDNPGNWTEIPSRCVPFVKEYMTGERYTSDCEAVARYALEHAKSLNVSGDSKDAWVFDVDETLISNINYFLGPGTIPDLDDQWWSPAIPSSFNLYYKLKQKRFKVFLLTGRNESARPYTVLNLLLAGYKNWDRLIMRGPDDEGTLARVYKSKKRQELVDEGYRIRGNMGDLWSDLIGYALGDRSFKMPNPMYYAP